LRLFDGRAVPPVVLLFSEDGSGGEAVLCEEG
jgi:hypothetical protein